MMSGAVILFFANIIVSRIFLFKNNTRTLYLNVAFWLLLHAPQIPSALKRCRPLGIPDSHIALKTAIFGATWWRYAAKGVVR